MWTTFAIVTAIVLFLLGLRLSAFFSGAETGFYRVSYLKLSIDTHAGDRVAGQIMWFVQNPSYFVATTLIGNNVANYVTTCAIGLATVSMFPLQAGRLEIVATLLLSPVVFVFGELIPKNLYFRAPLSLLRRDVRWFTFFYRAFLAVSFPLIWMTKLVERLGDARDDSVELVLGRGQLVHVLSQGHREGLLTEVQSRLVDGVLHTVAQSVRDSMTPSDRVLGIADDQPREAVLEIAGRFGVSRVAVKRAGSDDDWYGYVRVVDVSVSRRKFSSLIRTMPRISADASKLEALLLLRGAGQSFGVVCTPDEVLGIVSEQGLVEQLFRRPPALMGRVRSGDKSNVQT